MSGEMTNRELFDIIEKRRSKFRKAAEQKEKRRQILEMRAMYEEAGAQDMIDDDESVPDDKDRFEMLYEDTQPLIIPKLQINDAETSKRYMAMYNYWQKQSKSRKKVQDEKMLRREQLEYDRDERKKALEMKNLELKISDENNRK